MFASRLVRLCIRTRCLSLTSIQSLSTTTLQQKKIHDDERIYSEQIHRIADEISRLSLVEVIDLNELLKVRREEELLFD